MDIIHLAYLAEALLDRRIERVLRMPMHGRRAQGSRTSFRAASRRPTASAASTSAGASGPTGSMGPVASRSAARSAASPSAMRTAAPSRPSANSD